MPRASGGGEAQEKETKGRRREGGGNEETRRDKEREGGEGGEGEGKRRLCVARLPARARLNALTKFRALDDVRVIFNC